jgi:hypothetical protein
MTARSSNSAALRLLHLLLIIAISAFGLGALGSLLTLTNGANGVRVDATISERPLVIEQGDSQWELRASGGDRHNVGETDRDKYGDFGRFRVDGIDGHVFFRTGTDLSTVAAHRLGLALICLASLVALNLFRRIVEDARAGEPFSERTPRRLRLAGLAVLTIPVIANLVDLQMARADVGTAIELKPSLLPWWPFVLIGAGAFGLAEIFSRGAELRDFERLAI